MSLYSSRPKRWPLLRKVWQRWTRLAWSPCPLFLASRSKQLSNEFCWSSGFLIKRRKYSWLFFLFIKEGENQVLDIFTQIVWNPWKIPLISQWFTSEVCFIRIRTLQVVLPLAMMRRIIFKKCGLSWGGTPLLEPVVILWNVFTVKLLPISHKILHLIWSTRLIYGINWHISLVWFCRKAHIGVAHGSR